MPDEFIENLNRGIITLDMIKECLCCINEKIKKYKSEKDLVGQVARYYRQKRIFLSLLTPNQIHEVCKTKDFIEYFLFYDLGDCFFHQPLEYQNLKNYPTLPMLIFDTLPISQKEGWVETKIIEEIIKKIIKGDYKLLIR